jgi:hypothetical protein
MAKLVCFLQGRFGGYFFIKLKIIDLTINREKSKGYFINNLHHAFDLSSWS